jgi:hypothetical protein
MPSDLLIALIVECFNYSVCRLAQTDYCEVSCSIEHIIVVGSPFIAMNDVLLRLITIKLFAAVIPSKVSFECFGTLRLYVLDYNKSTAVVVSKLDRQTRLQLFFLFGATFTIHFDGTVETYQPRFVSTWKVEERLRALSILSVVATD